MMLPPGLYGGIVKMTPQAGERDFGVLVKVQSNVSSTMFLIPSITIYANYANLTKERKMFILSYIYTIILSLLLFLGSISAGIFWIFIASAIILPLLYANLIILCKYTAIFVNKTVNKEKLALDEIYYLITSLIIFVTVGVVLTPMYSSETDLLTTFFDSIWAYLVFLFLSLVMIVWTLVALDFSNFLEGIGLIIFMWANIIILCKYLYRFIRKIDKKELPTQKEIIYLITSIIIFFTIGMIVVQGFASV